MDRKNRNGLPRAFACSAFVAGLVAIAGSAGASPADGAGFIVPVTGEVFVTFDRQSAGAVGELYFLGADTGGSITSGSGLGSEAFLFRNRGVKSGETRSLGLYNAGETLHFLYRIVTGAGAAKKGDVLRTDDESTSGNFRFSDANEQGGVFTASLGVEDIRNPARADWDFNDVEFTLTTSPRFVPAPGPVVLGACGLALAAFPRRKRENA